MSRRSKSKLYGKLSPESLKELDALLLKLKELNSHLSGQKRIRREEIVPLPEKEYLKLWEYLRHCCKLMTCWTNVMRAIKVIASKRGMSFEEVQEECVDSLAIHCYIYAWRHYEHSDDCEYVLSTAKFGWKAWITEQNNYHAGVDKALEDFMEETPTHGRKVCNVNFA